jgi:hypothetical protein
MLGLPAVEADVEPFESVPPIKQQRVIRLLVGKGLPAGLTIMGAGLDVPIVHENRFVTEAIIAKQPEGAT